MSEPDPVDAAVIQAAEEAYVRAGGSPLLITEMTPDIVAAVQAQRDHLIEGTSSFLQREALIMAWPFMTAFLPKVLLIAYTVLLRHVGAMTIAGLTSRLSADYIAVEGKPAAFSLTLEQAEKVLNDRKHRGHSAWVLLSPPGFEPWIEDAPVGQQLSPFEARAIAAAYLAGAA